MYKIKIIDLLNKIANGEEVPNKIIYRNVPMIYDNGTEDYTPHQTDKFHGNDLFHYLFEEETKIFLNDEVEIIEEEPKPLTKQDVEAIGYACGEIRKCFENGWNKSLENKPFKEDKKIEKITLDDWIEFTTSEDMKNLDYFFNKNSRTYVNKINEIIDYLMESKDE